jgi:hypothetical protein
MSSPLIYWFDRFMPFPLIYLFDRFMSSPLIYRFDYDNYIWNMDTLVEIEIMYRIIFLGKDMVFYATFNNIWRKPLTCRKSLTIIIT